MPHWFPQSEDGRSEDPLSHLCGWPLPAQAGSEEPHGSVTGPSERTETGSTESSRPELGAARAIMKRTGTGVRLT